MYKETIWMHYPSANTLSHRPNHNPRAVSLQKISLLTHPSRGFDPWMFDLWKMGKSSKNWWHVNGWLGPMYELEGRGEMPLAERDKIGYFQFCQIFQLLYLLQRGGWQNILQPFCFWQLKLKRQDMLIKMMMIISSNYIAIANWRRWRVMRIPELHPLHFILHHNLHYSYLLSTLLKLWGPCCIHYIFANLPIFYQFKHW